MYITINELSDRWKLTRQSVEKLVRSGRLKAVDVAVGRTRQWRIRLDDVESFEQARSNQPETETHD